MRNLLLSAALVASALAPSAALAQRAPAAVVVVVDTDRIARECTACKAAATQLRSQGQTFQTRAQTLQNQLETARKPIQTAVEALGSKQPDAALQARITAYQQQEQKAQQELASTQRSLQSTQAHVNQQIASKLGPIINSVAAARGANIAIAKDATLYNAATVDVTADVLTQLNSQVPSVSVTPLPQSQQQPQGR